MKIEAHLFFNYFLTNPKISVMNFSRLQKKAAKNAWMIKEHITPILMLLSAVEGENILSICRGAHSLTIPTDAPRRGKYSAMYKLKHNISVSRKRN